MTSPSSPSDPALEPQLPERHVAPDGTLYWGDIDEERFTAAADAFPVLKYVLDTYYPSPENGVRPGKDAQFVAQYQEVGETTAEFDGLADDLTRAIRQYNLSTVLVNGLMAANFAPTECRALLSSLDDELHSRGEFAQDIPAEDADAGEDDQFRIASAPDRVRATFLHKRAIPIGPLKNHPLPLIAYIGVGVVLAALGVLITYIPVVGQIGVLFIIAGAIIAVVFAVGALGLSSDYNRADEDDEEGDEQQHRGLLSRLNPFSN